MNSLDFLDATDQTVRGAAQFSGLVGRESRDHGFCMGGAVTVIRRAACPSSPAPFRSNGIPPESVAKAADVRIPMQCHFAINDHWCTPEADRPF